MDDEELRKVGDAIEVGNTIRIGKLDVELTVSARPGEDNTGALIVEAKRINHPEKGVVTSVMFTLGHPSGGDNLMIEQYVMKETSDGVLREYDFGERLESNEYRLQQLEIVE